MDHDADLAAVASLIGDPTRARVLSALGDGRALPASVLASEAGVAASTTSEHLTRLVAAGLLAVQPQGRHRYYRLAGPEVAAALEALARIAPPAPIRSLREGTRAHAVRMGRSCYDHAAGQLGVALFGWLLDRQALVGPDGRQLSAATGTEADYALGAAAGAALARLGVDLDAVRSAPRRRPLLRYCLDWSEQRHHLAGALGAAVLDALLAAGWVRRARAGRALHLSAAGRAALRDDLGVTL